MHAKFIIAVLVLAGLYLIGRWVVNTPAEQVRRVLTRTVLVAIAGLLIFMMATGRLHWLFGVLGGLAPFARRLFALWRTLSVFKNLRHTIGALGGLGGLGGLGRGGPQRQNQSSNVETEYLRMNLDHDTGELSGVVIAGQFEGSRLEELELDQLRRLLTECRVNDEQSAAVLESYLDRQYGDQWRESRDDGPDAQQAAPPGPMTREEAYELLGLEPGAGKAQIKAAHRRLIQKFHPDRGGSTYLAAKINEAKEVLLGKV